MRDYPFSFDELNQFSNSLPYQEFEPELDSLFQNLNSLKEKYHFPAVRNDVGSFISLLCLIHKPKVVFEMGSGYGHSAFWFLSGGASSIESITLTEKRDDLVAEFEKLNWPISWKDKINYFQDDAFKVLTDVNHIDMALVDGVKADYKLFLEELYPKLNPGAVVLVDNSYWRGSFLNPELVAKKRSAANIYELHEYIKNSPLWKASFVPFEDGISLLTKV